MRRSRQHPDLGVERLLQQLEAEGVDPLLIERYVTRSLDRGPAGQGQGGAGPAPQEGL